MKWFLDLLKLYYIRKHKKCCVINLIYYSTLIVETTKAYIFFDYVALQNLFMFSKVLAFLHLLISSYIFEKGIISPSIPKSKWMHRLYLRSTFVKLFKFVNKLEDIVLILFFCKIICSSFKLFLNNPPGRSSILFSAR